MVGNTTDEYSPLVIRTPVPGAVEEGGKALCCTACTDGTSSSISEKGVGKNSLVGKGDSRCGPDMFWEGGASSKANEPRLKKPGVYGFYTQILRFEDEERPSNEDTHTIPVGRDDVGKGVAEVYGAWF